MGIYLFYIKLKNINICESMRKRTVEDEHFHRPEE
jgi:hypothetical protein